VKSVDDKHGVVKNGTIVVVAAGAASSRRRCFISKRRVAIEQFRLRRPCAVAMIIDPVSVRLGNSGQERVGPTIIHHRKSFGPTIIHHHHAGIVAMICIIIMMKSYRQRVGRTSWVLLSSPRGEAYKSKIRTLFFRAAGVMLVCWSWPIIPATISDRDYVTVRMRRAVAKGVTPTDKLLLPINKTNDIRIFVVD
jgi:hypothetical protein